MIFVVTTKQMSCKLLRNTMPSSSLYYEVALRKNDQCIDESWRLVKFSVFLSSNGFNDILLADHAVLHVK